MSLRLLFAMHGPADDRTAVYRAVWQKVDYLRRAGHGVDLLTVEDLRGRGPARFDPLLLPPLLAARGVAGYDAAVFHSHLGWAFHAARRWLDPGHRVATVTWFHGLEPIYHQALADELARDGRPLSARFRLLHGTVMPRLLKASCRRSDGVFCLNSGEADYLVRHDWARPERIHLVANGVEPECFMEHDGGRLPRRLLFVGQWLPAKGIRYLAEAFTAVSRRHDVELACVGTGAPADVVRASFPDAVRDRVRVRPRVDRMELRTELANADLFLFPSLSEGFSNALLEGMAAGLPIVATGAGAAADLLRDGVNAVVVPRADAATLEAGIERLLGDPAFRSRLGRSAHASAAGYDIERVNMRFAERLFEVVEGRAAVRGRTTASDMTRESARGRHVVR